jgi:hypothetical protein
VVTAAKVAIASPAARSFNFIVFETCNGGLLFNYSQIGCHRVAGKDRM